MKSLYKNKSIIRQSVMLIAGVFVCMSALAAEWEMPLANAPGNFQTRLAVNFAEQVRQATNNRVVIKTYSSGSLFKGEQIFGAVRNKLVPIGARLVSALDHENLLLQIDALPFLAKNYREALNLYKASKSDLEKILATKGVKLLYTVPWPSQGLYSKVKIEDISELEGKTFRPYSNVTALLGEKMKLKPIILPLAKVGRALKKQKLDLMFGSSLTAKKLNLPKYYSYWYELGAWLPKEMVVVNTQMWNELSVEDQNSILSIAKTIESKGWMKSKTVDDQAKRFLLASGMMIERPSNELGGKLEVIGLDIVQQWLKEIGDQGRYVLERYIKL